MASAQKNTRSNALSTEAKRSQARFVLCVRNKDYAASLEVRKVYRLLGDERAARHRQLRVIDESGEDYLYPEDYFVPIQLPESATKAMLQDYLSRAGLSDVRGNAGKGARAKTRPGDYHFDS